MKEAIRSKINSMQALLLLDSEILKLDNNICKNSENNKILLAVDVTVTITIKLC